jgi:hypothetical protein
VPEGTVPHIAVEGTAYDCGREYAQIVRERYPGYRRYLDGADGWASAPPEVRRLFERHAPHVLDLRRGLADGAGPPARRPQTGAPAPPPRAGCTSFGVSGRLTLDGHPISGQTKDPARPSALLFVVLRLRITGAPAVLTVAYPGELIGFGFWSTGMSLFRNSLFSSSAAERGLSVDDWRYLALAGASVHQAVELARRFGIRGQGNTLLSDGAGESLSVEVNAGGVSVVPAKEGIATHANHPEGAETRRFDCTWEAYGYGSSERGRGV